MNWYHLIAQKQKGTFNQATSITAAICTPNNKIHGVFCLFQWFYCSPTQYRSYNPKDTAKRVNQMENMNYI